MNIRKLLVPVAVIGLLGFSLMFFLTGQKNKAAQQPVQEKTTPVVVAKLAVPQGAEITMDALDTKQFTDAEMANVPTDALLESEKLVGGRARVAIAAGEFFTPTNTDPLPAQFSGMIEPGFVAVTFPAPPEPSLYDLHFLNPDDRVDVFGVYLDQGTGDTVSVRLASNVRLLAVDKVKSQAEEEARKRKLGEEIKQLEAQLTARRAQTTPPPSQEELDGMQKAIDAKKLEINPVIPEEERSLTVEVTTAQSQKIALWRQSADITVALHRESDAEQVIFGDVASLDGLPVGEPGAPVATGLVPQSQILTLDDVVPLDRATPAKYYQEQQAAEQHQQTIAERRLNSLELRANELETEAEIRNIQRYGTRAGKEMPAPSYFAGPLAAGGGGGGGGGGLTKQDLNQAMGGVNRRIGELEKKLDARPAAAAQPKPLRGTVEIYRGKDKTVEHY